MEVADELGRHQRAPAIFGLHLHVAIIVVDISGATRLSDISTIIISGFQEALSLLPAPSLFLALVRKFRFRSRRSRARDRRYFRDTSQNSAQGHSATSQATNLGRDDCARTRTVVELC